MTQENKRFYDDRDLLIAEISGENYDRLLTEYNDQLTGMIGVSMYIIGIVDELLQSEEYKKAIEYEKKNKEKVNARKRERYKTDLEYKEKERARRNKKFKERWATNEEWRKKKIQKTKDWFEKNKDAQIAYANKKKAKRGVCKEFVKIK